MITCFQEFCDELLKSGFSMGGGNAKGIFAVVPFDWKNPVPGCPIAWHTGEPETDPWEWRMRVLEERDDIAYGKVFFGASGYITREWYSYFLAVRRQGLTFDEWYYEGKAGLLEKRIYEAVEQNGHMAFHDLKRECEISKESAGQFERALSNLQKNLFLTMCGRSQKLSRSGEPYGWNSTVFTTVEAFWGEDLMLDITEDAAYEKIRERILLLNPDAKEKDIRKFIG